MGEVSKKWFRLRDTYGVEVKHGADPVLILAITVAIDSFSHDQIRRRRWRRTRRPGSPRRSGP